MRVMPDVTITYDDFTARVGNLFDPDCCTRQVLDRLADKWTLLVIYALMDSERRHSELKRMLTGISQKMLTQTLRSLETDGLVERTVFAEGAPHVSYRLTELGISLWAPLEVLCQWAIQHLPELNHNREISQAG